MAFLPKNIRWENDPGRSLKTGFHVDEANGEITIVHAEDVEHVLKKNEEQFRNSSKFTRMQDEWHHWARIPPGIYHRWKSELGVDIMKSEDWPKVVALLHDPEWRKLRVSQGNFQKRPARSHPTTVGGQRRRAGNVRAVSLIGRSGRVQRQGGI